jgi:gliding motility-associated-like protein
VSLSYRGGDLATASVGTYQITASDVAFSSGDIGNYSVTYVGDSLKVTPASLIVRAPQLKSTYGDVKTEIERRSDFVFTSTGYRNGDNQETVLKNVKMYFSYLSTYPAESEVVIDFDYSANVTARSNYQVVWIPGKIVIQKAELIIKAVTKNICEGTTRNALFDQTTLQISGYKNREVFTNAISGQIVNFITNYSNTLDAGKGSRLYIIPDLSLASSRNYELRVDSSFVSFGKIASVNTVLLDALCSNGVNLFNYTPLNGVDGVIPEGTNYTWTLSSNAFISGAVENAIAVNGLGTGQQLVSSASTVVAYTYLVTPVNGGCESKPFKLIVNVKPLPYVDAIADVSICIGAEKAISFSGSNQTDLTFVWSNSNKQIGVETEGTGNIVIKPSRSLLKAVESTIKVRPFANGCFGAEKSFRVQTKPTPTLPQVVNASQSICAGEVTKPIVFVDTLGATIKWSLNQVGTGLAQRGEGIIPSFKAQNTGSAPLDLSFVVNAELNGCVGPSATLAAIRINKPVSSQVDSYPAFACLGSTVGPFRVEKSTGGDFISYNYTWQVSSDSINYRTIVNSNSFKLNAPQQDRTSWYRVLTESGGCNAISKSVKVVLRNKPKVAITLVTNTSSISIGNSIQVFASGAESYEWTPKIDLSNPFISNPYLSPKLTTTFMVKGTDVFGCSAEELITINVDPNYSIIPNLIMTPNGDNINDTWEIKNIKFYPKNSIQLYDSLGGLIKQFDNYTGGWDGTINGQKLPVGNYYYIINLQEDAAMNRGFITILY